MVNLDEVLASDKESEIYETAEMVQDAYYKVYSDQGILGLDITKEVTLLSQSAKIIYMSKN